MVRCSACGLSAADMDIMSLGMCINYINAFIRFKREQNGENIPDPEKQYLQLKKIQPVVEERYKNGQITKEKYDNFMRSVWEYEEL